MKTTLLIGSGVSFYSDIPDISYITNNILTSDKIGRGTDTNYYLEGYLGYSIQSYLNGYVSKCQKLINHVKLSIDQFYTHIQLEHQTNYEDIYYVLRQIEDSYQLEYENPSTLKLIEYLLVEMNLNRDHLKELITESTRFIECIVWQSIDKPFSKFDQFNMIIDLRQSLQLETILSLNHDLVLEKWLTENSIAFDDGFHLDGKKLPEWKGFTNESKNIKLCKVHGSIDWFEFRITKLKTYDNLVKVPGNTYVERIHEIDNSFTAPNSSRPSLLIGTFNKMWGYLSGIHEIMYEELKKSIINSDIIIISGYGFGDKGINTRLTNWLARENSKKMIIINPNKDSLISNSRGSYKINIMTNQTKHPKVELIEKKFEEVTFEEIKRYCA
ncbi:MAG: SIR2 family protein [Bacteroidetes bacterium]|nr:SIR2 family protein [Bacteroidota bacterium]